MPVWQPICYADILLIRIAFYIPLIYRVVTAAINTSEALTFMISLTL